jgi:hypothetical protein
VGRGGAVFIAFGLAWLAILAVVLVVVYTSFKRRTLHR